MTTSGRDEIDDLRQRLSALIDRVDLGDDARELASEALEELAVVIEELHSQNAELIASRGALDEQTQRYRDLFETVADGYLITDTSGVIRESNLAACDMFGRPRDQVVGRPLATFIDAADRGAFYAQLSRIRHADAGGHLTVDLAVRDHETIPTNLRATRALPRAEGESEVMWLMRDRRHDLVTEGLRSSHERLNALFDTAQVGIVLCDSAGEILFVNPYARHVLGIRRDQTDQRAWLATTHPDDRTDVDSAVRAALDGEVRSVRHRVLHRDGTERWVDHSVAPFRESGEVTGFVSTIVDVTAERTAMTDLASSRDFTEALLDTAGALVIVIDPAGTVMRFNKTCETTTGFSASEIVGRSFVETLVPLEERVAASEYVAALSGGGDARQSGSVERDWLTTSGGRCRISWTYSTLTTDDGAVAIIGAGIDITERRLLESRVAQADRLDSIGRLTSGVAHDFNNTLATLRLRIDRLKGRGLDDASRADLEAADATIGRTQHLIADLLLFSSRSISAPAVVDVNTEIKRVTGILDELLGDDVTIDLDLTSNRTSVVMDAARLEQALTNLAINARDAMPEGGIVTVSTRVHVIESLATADAHVPARLGPGEYLVLSVADTGVGIQPGDLPHVFDPYFTTKPPGRGTGLGLATTYGTVVQSGGSIIVDSQPGHGTTFQIWLPLAPADDGVAGAPSARAAGASSDTYSVLVVDDDDELREVLVEELTRLGHRTSQAPTGAAALDQLGQPVDVLICDVQLPDLDGPDVATRFRQRHHDLVVVYISGAPATRVRDVVPVDAVVVPKPFTTDELVAAIADQSRRT